MCDRLKQDLDGLTGHLQSTIGERTSGRNAGWPSADGQRSDAVNPDIARAKLIDTEAVTLSVYTDDPRGVYRRIFNFYFAIGFWSNERRAERVPERSGPDNTPGLRSADRPRADDKQQPIVGGKSCWPCISCGAVDFVDAGNKCKADWICAAEDERVRDCTSNEERTSGAAPSGAAHGSDARDFFSIPHGTTRLVRQPSQGASPAKDGKMTSCQARTSSPLTR